MKHELAAKHNVLTAAKSSPTADFRADLANEEELVSLIKKAGAQVIINAVKPQMSTDQMEKEKEKALKLNAVLPQRIALLQKKHKYKIVHISTAWVYEGIENDVYTEASSTCPKNHYSRTKMLGEEMTRLKGTGNFIIARTEGVYGHDEKRTNLFLRLKDSERGAKPVFLAKDQFSQPTYGGELARQVSALLEKGKTGFFNCVGADYLSRHEFGIKICKEFGIKAKIEPFYAKDRKLRVPMHLLLDTSKIKAVAGKVCGLDEQFAALKRFENDNKKS